MHILKCLLAAAASSIAAVCIATAAPVEVQTPSGSLIGDQGNGVASFLGVPFAKPPTGPLRWAPPALLPPWTNKREALAYGPACLQAMRKDGSPNDGGAFGPTSEDCLTLNIFAPAGAVRAPVMVWIYGGGNVAGSSAISAYDGAAFARDGVVLVSFNYRLGPLGFFAHPALSKANAGASLGDYALMDQIAALSWVARNIKAFGGDPGNVTLFGESAGGQDTLALMTAPSARGLFKKAIVESGGGWNEPVTLAMAEARGVALAQKAGLGKDADVSQLRAITADKVMEAEGPFGPIVDGRLLPESLTQAFARGHAAAIPLIIGSNSFEASLMAGLHMPKDAYLDHQPPALVAAYAGETTPVAKAEAIFTDRVMGAPARWIAKRQSRAVPTWLYYFSFRRAIYKNALPGAPHASEIPFVFNSWDVLDPRLSRGAATPEDRALTQIMHACWVSFAKAGSPFCLTPDPWPTFSATSDRRIEFGERVRLLEDFRKDQLDAQEAVNAALLSP